MHGVSVVCVSVCMFWADQFWSFAKTDELIEMPFDWQTNELCIRWSAHWRH